MRANTHCRRHLGGLNAGWRQCGNMVVLLCQSYGIMVSLIMAKWCYHWSRVCDLYEINVPAM